MKQALVTTGTSVATGVKKVPTRIKDWREERAKTAVEEKNTADAVAPVETKREVEIEEPLRSEELSAIQPPTQGRFRQIGERFGSFFTQSRDRITAARETWQERRQQRQEEKEQQAAEILSQQMIDQEKVIESTPAEPTVITKRSFAEPVSTPSKYAEPTPRASETETVKPKITTKVVTQPAKEKPVQPKSPIAASIGIIKKKPVAKKPEKTVIEQAREALEKADYKAAEDVLIGHIVKNNKDIKAYLMLGEVAEGRQAWDEAIEIFEQISEWKPETTGINARLGNAAFHSGKYTKALQSLQRAHDEEPANTVVLEQLLTIARNMDNRALQSSITEKLEQLQASEPVA